jgi:ADP-ribose pyrophosphatase
MARDSCAFQRYNPGMLPNHLRSARREFQGSRFDVVSLDLRGRDGSTHVKEVIVHPGAVVILPVLDDGNIILIRNDRVAVGDTLWELPAGTLEPPEPPEECAARELIEETGYRVRTPGSPGSPGSPAGIVKLTEFYTSPGICTEKMFAFVARDIEHVGQALEATEQITVESVSVDGALDMIRRGEVRDGKTIATLLFFHTFLRHTH